MTAVMTTDTAIGWIIVGYLNDTIWPGLDLVPDPDEPLGGGCCKVNCGPCAALHWLSNHDRASLEDLIRLTGYNRDGWDFWDADTNGLRWDLLDQFWARHKACGISAGVLIPCERDRDEEGE